jgi:peptidoglycan/LPS O-acetylase OafA/YrhL
MWTRQSLADAFSPSDNSFGFLRLLFAFAVLVSHTWPLALGQDDPGGGITNGQASLGDGAVFGFFVISGFLITQSGIRFPMGRYLWHRALRILPGLWICLIVTAFVLAPLVAIIQHGNLHGFWSHPQGPAQYVVKNWFIAIQQYGISGLLRSDTSNAVVNSAFDGSLWSLIYEVGCYFMVAGFAVVGVLKRARWVVLAVTAVCFGLLVFDLIESALIGGSGVHGPVFGFHGLDWHLVIHLTYLFLLGALAELYSDRIPFNDGLALVAALALAGSMAFGGLAVFGYPAFAYLVVWLGIRLPQRLHGVGRRRDYSYGFYIYAFPVQQILALVRVQRFGVPFYIVVASIGTLILAVPSWHLVEKPAMALRNWVPPWRRPVLKMPATHETPELAAERQ